MNNNDKENVQKNFQQLQTLGEILCLIQALNIDELEDITTGSYLGEAVKLLKNVKSNLNLAIHELENKEDTISNQFTQSEISGQVSSQKTDRKENTKKMVVDYLTNVVFADIEIFTDRKSIADFFKDFFGIEYNLKKESRKDVVSRLCKLVLESNISIDIIGDALLKRTNSKYGSALKEKETGFLKSWYEAIEKM